MTHENMNKNIAKKAHLVWPTFIFFALSMIFSASEAPASGLEESRKKATAELLSVVSSADVETVTRLIQEGANAQIRRLFFRPL